MKLFSVTYVNINVLSLFVVAASAVYAKQSRGSVVLEVPERSAESSTSTSSNCVCAAKSTTASCKLGYFTMNVNVLLLFIVEDQINSCKQVALCQRYQYGEQQAQQQQQQQAQQQQQQQKPNLYKQALLKSCDLQHKQQSKLYAQQQQQQQQYSMSALNRPPACNNQQLM